MDDSSRVSAPRSLGPHEEEFLGRLIQKKARQIICRPGFGPCDRADIEQLLRLKVEQHLSAYRGERGHLFPFLTAIVERRAASIDRDQSAKKRSSRRTISLSVQLKVKDEGPVELAAVVSEAEGNTRLDIKKRSLEEASDLKHDIGEVLKQVTPDDRRVCEGLMHGSVSEVSKQLGIPRATIYEMLSRWRQPFEEAGLREYL